MENNKLHTTEQIREIETALKAPVNIRFENFSNMLLRLIDERGLSDAECYKSAQISKSHFNKIKNDYDYRIKKNTVLALALALNLNEEETDDFLAKAGYAMSISRKTDIIVGYCISRRIYNVMDVNELLNQLGEPPLTSV